VRYSSSSVRGNIEACRTRISMTATISLQRKAVCSRECCKMVRLLISSQQHMFTWSSHGTWMNPQTMCIDRKTIRIRRQTCRRHTTLQSHQVYDQAEHLIGMVESILLRRIHGLGSDVKEQHLLSIKTDPYRFLIQSPTDQLHQSPVAAFCRQRLFNRCRKRRTYHDRAAALDTPFRQSMAGGLAERLAGTFPAP